VISGDITVARLLDEHPELLEVLASYLIRTFASSGTTCSVASWRRG
jgi:hypothetical protein